METTKIKFARGINVEADQLIGQCSDTEYDLIVCPGGMPGAKHLSDNIVLVDTYNVLKRNSINLKEKDILIRTCAQRLRPVFLTSFTTVVGLLPLASSIGVDFISREVGVGGSRSRFGDANAAN